jgi:molecular chaperone DnaK (HSP70)
MGYYMRKLKKLYEIAGIMSNEIVISVPSYYSNAERQAVLDAADIA